MGNEVVHCNSCGSYEIEIKPHSRLGKCKSCGANVILPDLENHEILALLDEAFIARTSLKFADAFTIYSFIIQKCPDELAAYDGILLSKYGIIYEYSREKDGWVATSRVYNPKSIFDDFYYKYFINNCHNDEERNAFIERANEIDKLQKAYAYQLKNEKDYDVFISFKSKINGKSTEDALIARELYDELTDKLGLRVFMSDMTLKERVVEEYEPIIYKALHTSKVFILVGTSKDNIESPWVKNEWIRFLDRISCHEDVDRKSFIPVFKYMDPSDMPYPGNRPVQCVDASDLLYLKNVSDYISNLLGIKKSKNEEEKKERARKAEAQQQAQRQKEKEEYDKQMAAMKAAEERAKKAEEEAHEISEKQKESLKIQRVYSDGEIKESYFDKGTFKSVTTGVLLTIFFWPACIPYWIKYDKYRKTHKAVSVTYSKTKKEKKPISKKKKIVICSIAVIVVLIGLTGAITNGCSINDKFQTEEYLKLIPTFTSTQTSDFVLEEGKEYGFMPDPEGCNVYLASAFSTDTLKIERWSKSLTTTPKMTFEKDIGIYRINDENSSFKWIDVEKTSFVFNFTDPDVRATKNRQPGIFTININSNDENKCSNCYEEISCYSFTNDDWHKYRAIPLSENYIKIECWARTYSDGTLLYAYDYRLLNICSNDTDFKWNSNKTGFALTCFDFSNKSYWKEEKLVLFELEKTGCKYNTVLEYLANR